MAEDGAGHGLEKSVAQIHLRSNAAIPSSPNKLEGTGMGTDFLEGPITIGQGVMT